VAVKQAVMVAVCGIEGIITVRLSIGEGKFVAPHGCSRGTGVVTPLGVVSRDSESFFGIFRPSKGTLKVPVVPRHLSTETESAESGMELSKISAEIAKNAKRREGKLSAFGVNSWVALVR